MANDRIRRRTPFSVASLAGNLEFLSKRACSTASNSAASCLRLPSLLQDNVFTVNFREPGT